MRKHRTNEGGMALMLALLFVVLLTVIVVEFCYETQVEGSLAEHYVNEQQSYIAAKSAVARGMNLLAQDIDMAIEGVGPGGYGGGDSGYGGGGGAGGRAGGGGAYATDGAMFDCLEDQWAMGVMPEPINEAILQCMIDDEYGKINLNALVVNPLASSFNQQQTESTLVDETQEEYNEFVAETLRALFAYRGSEQDPVDAIVDWLDRNQDEQFEGAEVDYYEGLDPPFGCKDGPMHSVEELLMIPGITPEIFWGDPEEGQMPLTELLTVHGHPDGKININTAEYETLLAVGEAMQPQMLDLADTVMDYRGNSGQGYNTRGETSQQSGGYFASEDEVRQYLGIQEQRPDQRPAPQQDQRDDETRRPDEPGQFFPFVVESYVFRVRGHGMAGDSITRIDAYVWRNNGMSEEMIEPFRILDWRVMR